MIDEKLLNPFAADPQVEFPHAIQSVPLWTEYCYFFGYCAKAQRGVTIHVGREPYDPRLWRATVAVYLPGEDLLVVKCSGRDGHARGPGAGPLRISCIEPMRLWTVEFDGTCQPTTRTQSMTESHRDTPGEPVRFFLRFHGAAPFWEMGHGNMEGQSWGSRHWEQICRVNGSITYRGQEHTISGAGVRDHSVGPRDYGPVIGNFWTNALFEDGSAMLAQLTRSENLGTEINQGYVFRNDGSPLEIIKVLDCPAVNTLDTPRESIVADPVRAPDKNFAFVIQTKAGEERIEAELLHSAATTYISPNDELLGTDFRQLDSPKPNASQLTESVTMFRWNGKRGIGNRERIVQLTTLKRP